MLVVLRLGHRVGRDLRITTHVALTARAMGCDKVMLSGEKDESVIASIKNVVEKWGGSFTVEYQKDWKKIVGEWEGRTVHLTMYGEPVEEKISEIRKFKNLLIIVGSEKVPGEVYKMSTYNISITSQPISEVSALAVFLHEYFKGSELGKKFKKARIKIIPQAKGKKIERGYD